MITGARLRVHPEPPAERRTAWSFETFAAGLDVCRRVLRRGATPAVLRLYDAVESERSYHLGDDRCILLVLDEGDPGLIDAVIAVVEDEAAATGTPLDHGLLDTWLAKRNDVSQLEQLITGGFVVDTMEVSGPWAVLPGLFDTVLAAIGALPETLAVSAHCSHSYVDGACLYFTFAARPVAADGGDTPTSREVDALHRRLWDAGTNAVLAGGGSLSHHHGVGLNRGRFVAESLDGGFEVLRAVKTALDPKGILNPGKLGLTSAFGSDGLL